MAVLSNAWKLTQRVKENETEEMFQMKEQDQLQKHLNEMEMVYLIKRKFKKVPNGNHSAEEYNN